MSSAAPTIIFAFGPGESFFFYSPGKEIHHRTNSAFTVTVPPKLKIPFSVGLGPGDNEYAAFYINTEHGFQYSMNFPNNATLQPVVDFLVPQFRRDGQSLIQSRLVLGPSKTFIAITPSAIRYGPEYALSASFLAMMESRSAAAPRMTEAALGYNGAWWVRLADGHCQWNFASGYTELEAILNSGAIRIRSINFLALSPYSAEHYFIVYEGRKVHHSLPAEFAKLIQPAIAEYLETPSQPQPAESLEADDDVPPPYNVLS